MTKVNCRSDSGFLGGISLGVDCVIRNFCVVIIELSEGENFYAALLSVLLQNCIAVSPACLKIWYLLCMDTLELCGNHSPFTLNYLSYYYNALNKCKWNGKKWRWFLKYWLHWSHMTHTTVYSQKIIHTWNLPEAGIWLKMINHFYGL